MQNGKLIDESEDLVRWIDSRLHNKKVPSHRRSRFSAGALYIAQQHHRSIVLLVKNDVLASAFALMRLMNEAYVRGIWLRECASDQELDKFQKKSFIPSCGLLVKAVETLEPFNEGVFSRMKEKHWKMMNDFTHTGVQQILRQNTDESIEQNYEEAEIDALLNHSNSISLLAGIAICRLIEDVYKTNNDLAALFLEKAKEISSI